MGVIDLVPHLPEEWGNISKYAEFEKRELQRHEKEYETYKQNLANPFTWRVRGRYTSFAKVCKATFLSANRVMNPFMYGRFLLRQEEYKSRGIPFEIRELYHVTSPYNVDSILRGNLDWRRVTRAKFGKGVSFSPSISYANKECNRNIGNARAIIVCKVIIGKCCLVGANSLLPYSGCDTTIDRYGNVYVKYYDDEFLPTNVINCSVDIKVGNNSSDLELSHLFNSLIFDQ